MKKYLIAVLIIVAATVSLMMVGKPDNNCGRYSKYNNTLQQDINAEMICKKEE